MIAFLFIIGIWGVIGCIVFYLQVNSKLFLIVPLIVGITCGYLALTSYNDLKENKEYYNEQIEYYNDMGSEENKNHKRFGSVEMAEAYDYQQQEWRDEAKHYAKEIRDDKYLIVLGTIGFILGVGGGIIAFLYRLFVPFKEDENNNPEVLQEKNP